MMNHIQMVLMLLLQLCVILVIIPKMLFYLMKPLFIEEFLIQLTLTLMKPEKKALKSQEVILM